MAEVPCQEDTRLAGSACLTACPEVQRLFHWRFTVQRLRSAA